MPGAARPVRDWNPPLSGDMDCVIRRDGRWFIDGEAVNNLRLARLFASVLKHERGEYFLVTPIEKWRITVEDLPFLVVELQVENKNRATQVLRTRTNLGEWVAIGADHGIAATRIKGGDAAHWIPYVEIRPGLAARFNRSCLIELAALLQPGEESDSWRLRSGGVDFILRNL